MSDLVVYGMILSQPTLSTLMFCSLSSAPFTFHPVDLVTEENLSDWYTKVTPFQAVPAISHNGFTLWESAAIVAYVADAFDLDTQWYPKDIKARGRINAYLHWHHTNTRAALDGYFTAKVLAPTLFGSEALNEVTEAPYLLKVNEWLDTFTWMLAKSGYTAGTERPSVADIFVYNELSCIWRIICVDRYPDVRRWYEEIGEIDEVKRYTREAAEVAAKVFPAN
jgi:glutathione S-transferase